MYCRNCGKEVAEKAEICLNCGVKPFNGANFCQNCGANVNPDAEICIKCGMRLAGAKSLIVGTIQYAGFWKRFVAAIIDGIILTIGGWLIGSLIGVLFGWFGIPLAYLVGFVGGWLYYALMESSEKQATLGKQALGIIVTDIDGNRISFGRATGRDFAKFISSLTLLIGYIMAGFTEKKQALHDIIANCLVINRT